MRRNEPPVIAWFFVVLVIFGIAIDAFHWLEAHPAVVACIVGLIVTAVAMSAWANRRALIISAEVVQQHVAELTIHRKQLTTSLSYGLVDFSKWLLEVEFFIERVIEPRAGTIKNSAKRLQAVRTMIDAATADFASSRTGFSIGMDPIAYELLVADRLRDLGWDTRLTKGSGDQGVDVIAEMREKRVVIQCKRYGSSIGNAAVQEAYAGKAYEDADYAAVVSNAKYTPGARSLADSTRVILLHHDELTQLEEQIFETDSWRSLEARVPHAAAGGYAELAKRQESHSRKVIVDALSIALMGVVAAILSRLLDIR